ncbi:hypothetical protein Hte_008931 [Hypoxylon texense]
MTMSILHRLPEELLRQILEDAMTRDSPFQIDFTPQEPNENNHIGSMPIGNFYWPPLLLKSSAGITDPLSVPTTAGCPHRRSQQHTHVTDWIAVNSTCRLIRRLGRAAFFNVKRIAMRSTLPADLMQPGRVKRGFARILSATPNYDPQIDLALIRDLVLVDSREGSPMWWVGLPTLLGSFPVLRRCTLLFGHRSSDGPEWVTAAVAVASPARQTVRELLLGIGVSDRLVLEETVGTGTTWDENRATLEKYVYPIVRLKIVALKMRLEDEAHH